MTTTEYTVTGMTCGHCVNSVREEVGRIDGVDSVDIDLATGLLRISAGEPIPAETVLNAVTEAGYTAATRN